MRRSSFSMECQHFYYQSLKMFGSLPIFSKDIINEQQIFPMESTNQLKREQISNINPNPTFRNRPLFSDFLEAAESSEEKTSNSYSHKEVPIYSLERKRQWMHLNPSKGDNKKDSHPRFARGRLVGGFNVEQRIEEQVDFVGNFEGVFEIGRPLPNETYAFYFEGNISHLKLLRIQGQEIPVRELGKYYEITSFLGFFKGLVLNAYETKMQLEEQLQTLKNMTKNEIRQYQQRLIRSRRSFKREYFVPAFARFQIGKIREICLQKSSAQVWGTLFISIQMNREISELFKVEWQQKRKHKFHVNFNRSSPFDFPFYDPKQFEVTEDETEYEWDDIWEGIHWTLFWNEDRHRMQYTIQTKFTVEMDNSHGVFFAPFNLTILRIIVTLHSITINQHCMMHISVCDLHDFNSTKNGKQIQYIPYTEFSSLEIDQGASQIDQKYQKHVDRLTKISSPSGRDMGEFKIATNRLFLFPYHRRVFVNSNTQSSNWAWMLGLSSKSAYFNKPEVLSIKDSYLRAAQHQGIIQVRNAEVFMVQRWNYIHIEIPIYKYPVIDLISIFVPIVILAAISMLIFGQQNGKSNGFSLFAKRIASSCNLLIAYVTLIPLIRSKLPPSPSITLIEIVIYLSTVPNFLAVLSVYITGDILVTTFFQTFRPFYDFLFEISFLISSISFAVMVILISIYISKGYRAQFSFKRYRSSSIKRICAPFYLQYMDRVSQIRKQLTFHKNYIIYNDDDSD